MSEQRRPKVGDRVRVLPFDGRPSLIGKTGTVIVDDGSSAPFKCSIDGTGRNPWFSVEDLEVLPGHPWDVLREAADIEWDGGHYASARMLRVRADQLEAAARPKPSLREAAQTVVNIGKRMGFSSEVTAAVSMLEDALARGDAA